MKIGLLGGTFDPVHNGHLALAKRAYDVLSLDKVLFIPSFLPPHKEERTVTPVLHRLKMLEIALNGYPFCEVSDIEISKERVVYTIDTLRELRERYTARVQLFFLVGSDFIDQYKTWKEYALLNSFAQFMIAARPGFSAGRVPEGMQLLEGNFPLVSSTDLRIIIRNNENVSRYLPAQVIQYIKQHELYSV